MYCVPEMDLVHTTSTGQKFYIGSIPDDYAEIGVGAAVCCVADMPKNSNGIEVLQIPFRDTSVKVLLPTNKELERWIKTMKIFIDDRDVFIHCHAGINRSVLITALYLWEYHQSEFKNKLELIAQLKQARMYILQNKEFERLIMEW